MSDPEGSSVATLEKSPAQSPISQETINLAKDMGQTIAKAAAEQAQDNPNYLQDPSRDKVPDPEDVLQAAEAFTQASKPDQVQVSVDKFFAEQSALYNKELAMAGGSGRQEIKEWDEGQFVYKPDWS